MAHYECSNLYTGGTAPFRYSILYYLDYDFVIGGHDPETYPGIMTRDKKAGSAPMLHSIAEEIRDCILVPIFKDTEWKQVYPFMYISSQIYNRRSLTWINYQQKPGGFWKLICVDLQCDQIVSQSSSGVLLAENPKVLPIYGRLRTPWTEVGCITSPSNKISYLQAKYTSSDHPLWEDVDLQSKLYLDYRFNRCKRTDFTVYMVSKHPSDMEDIYYQSKETGLIFGHDRIVSNMREAFSDAASKMPQQTMNILENLLDIIDLFKDPKSLLKIRSLSDLWLKYRYVYSTTKLDVKDTGELLSRLKDLSDRKVITVSGNYSEGYDNVFEQYKFKGKYSVESFLTGTLTEDLQRYAGKVRLQDLWDVVPFSFIADWLTNIGNNISNIESYCELQNIKPIETWTTMTRTLGGGTVSEEHFLRIKDYNPVGLPRYQFNETKSGTTIMSRITDVVSIFGGK